MKFDRFEDMIVWQNAQELVIDIYKTLQPLKDFGFKDQIQRAAVSISNNIAEGFERKAIRNSNNFYLLQREVRVN